MLPARRALHSPPAQVALPRLALVIDEDRRTRELYAAALVPRRFVVEQAGDGREALAKAIAEPPDVIVMEATLPGITGYDLCQLLRRDRDTSTVPILVVTADADPQAHQRLHAAGADLVLSKPCAPTVLVSQVDEAIEQAGSATHRRGTATGSSNGAHQQRMSHALRRYETTRPLPRLRRCSAPHASTSSSSSAVLWAASRISFRNSGTNCRAVTAAANSSTATEPASSRECPFRPAIGSFYLPHQRRGATRAWGFTL